MTTVTAKVIILPTPVEPELVDHSRTALVPHSGEEIEGSGSEGHPVAIVTPRTTVNPPIVDHSRTTPGPHSGEEIEGSGIDGHPVAIVTSRTTHIGHDGQGHIVAVTTTTSGPDEGSGSGLTEHEGNMGFCFTYFSISKAKLNSLLYSQQCIYSFLILSVSLKSNLCQYHHVW